MTDLAPIVIVTAGRMQCNVAYWLQADYPAMFEVRPLCPQQQTFEFRCPLSRRFRPLHLQEQTFLLVSPKVRS